MMARIYEDNAGGLHHVMPDGRSISDNSGDKGKMLADLILVADWIDDVRAMHKDDADHIDYEGACFGEYGAKLIAEYADGVVRIWPERMGAAGERYVGL